MPKTTLSEVVHLTTRFGSNIKLVPESRSNDEKSLLATSDTKLSGTSLLSLGLEVVVRISCR